MFSVDTFGENTQFKDTLSDICPCEMSIETTEHFLIQESLSSELNTAILTATVNYIHKSTRFDPCLRIITKLPVISLLPSIPSMYVSSLFVRQWER